MQTVAGKGLSHYTQEPKLIDGKLQWVDGAAESHDTKVLRSIGEPFQPDGGLRLMQGKLGRGVIKISAVAPEHRVVKAPAIVFNSQEEVQEAFDKGELKRDFVAVVRFQGARANGMPELHRLTPLLGVLQDQGFHVALVTDGRMSGASGKVPAVIHVSPEALLQGPLGKVRTGDMIVIDAHAGVLDIEIDAKEWAAREVEAPLHQADNEVGFGRELFGVFRSAALPAEEGASVFGAMIGETLRARERTARRERNPLRTMRAPRLGAEQGARASLNDELENLRETTRRRTKPGVASNENGKRNRASGTGDSGAGVRIGRAGRKRVARAARGRREGAGDHAAHAGGHRRDRAREPAGGRYRRRRRHDHEARALRAGEEGGRAVRRVAGTDEGHAQGRAGCRIAACCPA